MKMEVEFAIKDVRYWQTCRCGWKQVVLVPADMFDKHEVRKTCPDCDRQVDTQLDSLRVQHPSGMGDAFMSFVQGD